MARQSAQAALIAEALRPAVADAGLYLEDATVGQAGRRAVVRVVIDLVDGPGGVDSDTLANVSRAISKVLDDVDLVKGAYTLEVSTPGAERPLCESRHFRRAIDHLVEIGYRGETIVGRVVNATNTHVTLDIEGKKQEFPIAKIASARSRVELNRPTESKK